MKPSARRVTLIAVAAGAALLGVLTVANWPTVRDHVEAWHFQLTTETKKIEPWPRSQAQPELSESSTHVLWLLAISARIPIVFDPENVSTALSVIGWESEPGWYVCENSPFTTHGPIYEETGSTPNLLRILSAKGGYRVLEQRFPRRAYVVIRDAGSIEQTAERPIPRLPQRRVCAPGT